MQPPVIGLRKYRHTGESQYSPITCQPATGHQSSNFISAIISEVHAIGMEFTNNLTSLKRVLLPLEPNFSNMSDPSVVVEPPDNNWRSDNRQVSLTLLSGNPDFQEGSV